MAHEYHRELELACKAVQLCAVLTDRVQKQTLDTNTTLEKWDRSPVTICDIAVQALLTSAVQGEFPDDLFLAEEGADEFRQNGTLLNQVWALVRSVASSFEGAGLMTPASRDDIPDLIDLGGKNQLSSGHRTWVFDPIDGTATFLKGQQYAINCAFLIDGREEIGIIGCPNLSLEAATASEQDVDHGLGLMVCAVRQGGTFARSMQNSSNLAPATKVSRSEDASLVWTDCSTYTSIIKPLHQKVAAELSVDWPGVDLYSSLVKYAACGLGRANVCIRIFKYGSWKSNMYVL